MGKVALLTDSTAYLHPEMLDKYGIHTIPLNIQWGSDSYKDNVTITPTEFYERLEKDPVLPTTSQPSVQDFTNKFKELAKEYDSILAILISSGVSGTFAWATSAAQEFSEVPIEIVDSRLTASGLAMVVLEAGKALAEGKPLEEVAEAAREMAKGIRLFFVVDTLKYLHKGGRIGGASRYLGTALQLKPILYLNEEGKIGALERVRTKRKALARLLDLVDEQAAGQKVVAGIMHATDPTTAEKFSDQLTARLDCDEVHIFELSPVIGTHVGPGTIGVCVTPA